MFIPPVQQPWTIPILPNGTDTPPGGNQPDHVGIQLSCSKWDFVSPDSARLQAQFPKNTSEIFINNMAGGWVGGTLHVYEGDTGTLPGYHVQVEARPRMGTHTELADIVKVCILGGNRFGSYGVGIYNVRFFPLSFFRTRITVWLLDLPADSEYCLRSLRARSKKRTI